MSKTIVLCNHSDLEIVPGDTSIIHINSTPPHQNLTLKIDNITHPILNTLDDFIYDLIEIATFVYYADCSITRGNETDVYGEKWKRQFNFIIPVSNPGIWNQDEIKDLLKEIFEFLTGDVFNFKFIKTQNREQQLYLSFPDTSTPFPGADCICLFSGGLDSLIGSLYLLKEKNERPLLISHRSLPKLDSLQKNLWNVMKDKIKAWEFPHLSVWINRKGNRAIEATQRSRSFLYLTIAASVAVQVNIPKVYICENGIISFNIPRSGQNIGTLLTRSTHPKFLKLFEQLINKLYPHKEITIENPFIFLTKPQMLIKLKSWNLGELIQATISCSYTQGRTKMQPHCGVCSQCVDRRFSIAASNLENNDALDSYEKDIFQQHLEEGKETAYVEGYVRTAFEISEMNDIQFFSKYSEIYEVLDFINLPSDACGQKIYDLFQSHANEVIKVATSKCNYYQKDLLSGKLPDNCLISILAHRRHLMDPMNLYTDKIIRILGRSLRIDFQTEKPDREIRLHEAGQAILAAANERLNRESPMLSYSIIQTKPDFSKAFSFDRTLFIEFKLLNHRYKLNEINTEITSRITIYRDQGAYVLFVVYDTGDFISDDEEYIIDFERHDKIRVSVVR